MRPESNDNNECNCKDNNETACKYLKLNSNGIFHILYEFIAIIAVVVTFMSVYIYVDPTIRGFYCNDTKIFYPKLADTVSNVLLILLNLLLPILLILFIELLFMIKQSHNNWGEMFKKFTISNINLISLFILGLSINLLLSEICKRFVGRLRPYFIQVCDPDFSKINCTSKNDISNYRFYNYINTGNGFCRGDPILIKEARLSFPSGHSSNSFYAMVFLSFYFQARLVFPKLRLIKHLLQIIAFTAAFITSLTRISDNRHHGTDVIGGAILGSSVAVFTTLLVGKILLKSNKDTNENDFELKTKKNQNIQNTRLLPKHSEV